MKEQYEAPRIEMLEFDYADVITASGRNEKSANNYNNDPNGQYFKCTGGSYYAPGWGQNC